MGSIRIMRAAVLAAFAAMPSMAGAFETAAVISGIAEAHDGDDVKFGNVRVRLQGIAAPESREPGGLAATESLRAMVSGKLIVCHLDGTTAGSGGRGAGVCYLGPTDLGRHQVEAGLARDCPAYSGGRYADAEQAARATGRDLSATYSLPPYC